MIILSISITEEQTRKHFTVNIIKIVFGRKNN